MSISRRKRATRFGVRRGRLERLENRSLLTVVGGPFLSEATGELSLFTDDANNDITLDFLNATTYRLVANGASFDYAVTSVTQLFVITGEGNDRIEVAADVTVRLYALSGEGNDKLVGGAGNDTLIADTGSDTVVGGAGNDVLDAVDSGFCFPDRKGNSVCGPSQSPNTVLGGDGDDSLFGNALTDVLDGGPGDNIIFDDDSSDCVSVFTTDRDPPQPNVVFFDFVDADTARVTVTGISYDFPRALVTCFEAQTGASDDLIEIGSMVDIPATLIGGDGNDTLIGGAGTNSLDGGNGDDSMVGGPGDDTLIDGMGNDTLDGGGGNDVFIMSPGSDDVIRDSAGDDTIDFSRALRGASIDLGVGAGRRQFVDANRNTISLRGDIENAVGSPFADDLIGSGRPNRLDGDGGDDTLDGGNGDRGLHGRPGGRPVDRRSGAGCDGDTLAGGDGADFLDGGRGRDALDGGDGDDTLVGDALRDVLTGGAGINVTIPVVKTSDGCPAISAETSPPPVYFDAATGLLGVSGDANGATDDTIAVSLANGDFVEVSMNGVLHSSDPASASFDAALAEATVESVTIILVQGLAGNDVITFGDGFVNAEDQVTLDGGAGNDRVAGSSLAEVLIGGAGNDTLVGGAGADTFVGGAGNDSVDGGAGSDTADFSAAARGVKVNLVKHTAAGGDGKDRLDAIENVIGSRFKDSLVGDLVANILFGGAGNDRLDGSDGDDVLDGGLGNDQLRGGNGADRLRGAGGNDQLMGDAGDDSLEGASGNDLVRGGLGDDRVVGDLGVDQLFGDDGYDRVIADLFDRAHDLGPGGGDLIGV